MNRKRRTLLLLFLPLVVLMTISAGMIYRDYRQQRLNHDLIASLKRGDVAAEVRLLNAGADANARDMGDRPVNSLSVLRDYWQRLRTGKPAETEFHMPAILVFIMIDRKLEDPALDEKDLIAITVPLLDYGANINSQDIDRSTALSRACASEWSDLARFLIDRGADVNAGDSPLATSISNQDLELVRALLKAGANVNSKDQSELTPVGIAISRLEAAKQNKNTSDIKSSQEILRLLQHAGAHE